MSVYDYLVSLGEQTAQNIKGIFHDIGSLMIVFFPVCVILGIVVTVIDFGKNRRKKK